MLEPAQTYFLLTQAMQAVCREKSIQVYQAPVIYCCSPHRTVRYGTIMGVAQPGSITLREDLHGCDRLYVWVHEFAHEMLHYPVTEDMLGNRMGGIIALSPGMQEAEADGVAIYVCEVLGIDHPHYEWGHKAAYSWEEMDEPARNVARMVLNRWDDVVRDARNNSTLAPMFAGHERFPIRSTDFWRAAS